MKIAPIDIAHKNFSKKMWGLDAEEVVDFLHAVSEELESLLKERNQLRESVREKELAILEYRERDKVLKETITTAQRMTERIREEADRESKLIVSDAHQKAEMIVKEARESLRKLYRDISDLQKARTQFEVNLKALVQSHLGLMESNDQYMPKVQLPDFDFSAGQAPERASPQVMERTPSGGTQR